MKKDIHPEYTEAKVVCSCGESFTTRSTKSMLRIELCSKCHPFYTGKQKLVDTGGRVERFQKLVKRSQNEQVRRGGIESVAETAETETPVEAEMPETPAE